MNKNITTRIIQYLETQTHYAIILSGEYGIGKTHFIKKVVFPKVEQILIKEDGNNSGIIRKLKIWIKQIWKFIINRKSKNHNKFKTIHISLFGVKNIEDIQKNLFLEIYPILKSMGAKITKGVLKGLGQFFSIDIDDLVVAAKLETKRSGFEHILICIDDIDRKNPELELTEVYGYINDLVENYAAKIVLIANEDRLRKEQDKNGKDSYSVLKEKVIGVTLPFVSDPENALDQIIKEHYKEKEPEYYEFLKIHKQEIIKVIRQADSNLRNLLFFLEHFKIVFKEALRYFDANPEAEQYKEKLKKLLLAFTLPLAIEYKLGKLDEANQEIIRELYTNNSQFDFSKALFGKNTVEVTYRDEFKDKYFKDVPMDKNFFPSVFNYILGSDEFTKEKLGEDIAIYLKITDKTVPEEQKLLLDLGYWDCISLNETDYKAKTEELLAYMRKGRFRLDQYVTVFHYATRFNNILAYDLEKLKEAFFKSLQDNISKFEEIPGIKFRQGTPEEAEFRDYLTQINDKCLIINERIKNENVNKHWLNKYQEFKDNFDHFIDESRTINSATSDEPYFFYFPAEEAAAFILSLSNMQIVSFTYYIKNRYKPHNAGYLSADKTFLDILQSSILTKQAEPGKDKIDKYALTMLNDAITNVLAIINPHSQNDTDK